MSNTATPETETLPAETAGAGTSGAETSQNGSTSRTEVVASLSDLAVGSMKMATVGERRLAVIRTKSGVHALDNACPHQGYGLVTGDLDGEVVTCQWHNWKFSVIDGSCLRGEEAVACHDVVCEGDNVIVTVVEPTVDERRETLWPSLRSGIENHYVGQIARDGARLLDAEAAPADVVAEAIAIGAPKTEYGVGHEMALAADCLAWAEIRTGDERVLPISQGVAGISEVTRGRTRRAVPEADGSVNFGEAIEREDVDGAMAWVMAQLAIGVDPATIRHAFIEAVSQHHLGYGHGIIYTQKAFEMLDRIGWDHAAEILPHLAVTVAWSTREDLLPYMRKAMRVIVDVDLETMAAADDRTATGWIDPVFVDQLLDASEAPIGLAVDAVRSGAGVEGLLDAVTLGASRRLLRHDLDVEFSTADPFGWLDVTHALTMSRAARWAWQSDPGPHTARLALFATWLLFDSGRAERRHRVLPEPEIEPVAGDLIRAAYYRDEAAALGAIKAADYDTAVRDLQAAALADSSGSFIVTAHVIKLAHAAAEEALTIGSDLPLLAAARFVAAPRRERFVGVSAAESVDFVRTGAPPRR